MYAQGTITGRNDPRNVGYLFLSSLPARSIFSTGRICSVHNFRPRAAVELLTVAPSAINTAMHADVTGTGPPREQPLLKLK